MLVDTLDCPQSIISLAVFFNRIEHSLLNELEEVLVLALILPGEPVHWEVTLAQSIDNFRHVLQEPITARTKFEVLG
jgi:hypothetical protein